VERDAGLAGLDHETKFVLCPSRVAAVRVLLRGVAHRELPFPANVVESIYFDDGCLSSFEEKRASEFIKTKLRLRWYDGDDAVFLECKQRFGTRRRKLRARVPLAAGELRRDGLAALGGVSLAALAPGLGAALAGDLAPTVHLRYRRERFVAATGERLCLDSDIEAVAAAPRLGGGRRSLRLPAAVFELKGSGRALPPGCAGLATLGARRASFSKYSACLEALTA